MKRLFNLRRTQPPKDPQKWVPILGELQKTLLKGEYLPLRPLPMFESNFVQVTNHGAPAFVHHRTNKLTMGVAASLPGLLLPDILLLARPPEGRECSNMNLTRMIPLDLAQLYVHDLPSWRLKLRLITGRYYYLELDAPDDELGFLFDRWIRLINLLHEPTISWAPRTMDMVPLDTPLGGAPASTWRLQDQAACGLTVEVAERTFPYKIFSSQKQKKTKSVKQRLRSQAVGDSLPLIWSHLQPAEEPMGVTEKKSYLDPCPNGSKTLIHVSEKASITIRTIFSIISGTMNQEHSSTKACRSDSEVTTGRGRLIETPTQCISHNSPGLPFIGSCDHMDAFLWAKDLEDLIDTESSTTLSSSLHPSSYPPAFYILPPSSSHHKSGDKARPVGSTKHNRPLSSQKAASAPVTLGKTPFLLDQSNKVPAEPASTQKVPGFPAPSQKAQKSSAIPNLSYKALPSVSQKTPPIPGSSRKVPVLTSPPQKTLPPVLKLLQTPAAPQKVMPPKKEHLAPNTQSQKSVRYQKLAQKSADSRAKALGDASKLPAGDTLDRKPVGKQEPVLLVGGQKTKVVDMRTQAMSLKLPTTTTKKQSKEILITKTQEITLETLKARGKLEDRARKMREETTVNLPDLKSKEIGMQKRWVTTHEMALEGPRTEDNRPFSVEGLALAKMMILANSKQEHVNPTTISLPSWFSMTSRGSVMSALPDLPFQSSQMTLPEGGHVQVREQPTSQTKVKENTQPLVEEPPEDLPRTSKKPTSELPKTVSDNTKVYETSQFAAAAGTTDLKDEYQPLTSLTSPMTKTESTVRVPQKQGLKKGQVQQQPVAVVGSKSEVLFPVVLEIEKQSKMDKKDEEVKGFGNQHAQ